MAGNGIASMTMVKMKEISTSICEKVSRKMLNIDFIGRNRKRVILFFLLWLVAMISGYFSYRIIVDRARDVFFQLGTGAAENLATKSGPFVLENDILALNVAVKEFEDLKDLKVLAVLDHRNMIFTHTDPGMINRKFKPFENQLELGRLENVRITSEVAPDKTKVIGFWKTITFANVEIGKVYLAFSSADLHRSLERIRFLHVSGIVFVTILLVCVLFLLDRSARSRASKVREDLEKMNRIGPYLLIKKIAQGGMAELFLSDYVRQDGFRRRVAVKRILPNLAENEDFIQMFTREARLAALLQHPNIVQIFDYGMIDKAYFIAMEYIEGMDLGEIISKHKQGLPVDLAVFILSEICKGLDYSHSRKDDGTGEPLNIVHRDISPQNMLISCQGEVKISDFGISKARSEPSLTQAGVIKGKLAYLSIEQALGEPVDGRADIYALGLVFYETLTGARVYKFASDVEAIRSIPKMEITPLIDTRPQVPKELNRIVMKCLIKDRDLRYQRASELYADLLALRKGLGMTLDTADLSNFMRKNFPPEDTVAIER